MKSEEFAAATKKFNVKCLIFNFFLLPLSDGRIKIAL